MTKLERNKSIFECHKQGITQKIIGKIFSIGQSAVSQIIASVKKEGIVAKEETRGVKSRLTNEQKEKLKSILSKSPKNYGYFTWDKWSIKSLISNEFKVNYHENYICEIMKCINFSSQRPQIKDYRKDPEKVKIFKAQTAESIKKKAESENRRIGFQDEAAVRLLPSVSKTYAPIGQTPELECDVKNKDFVSISGAISPDGYFFFEVREKEGFKQRGLTRFLDNMVADCKDRISIVWDNAPSHTSKTVKKYLENQNKENPIVWLSNIPPYSPELNPIEQVWGYLKKKLTNQFVKTTSELKELVTKTLNEMKNDKELIKSFFKHPEMECYQFSF